MSEALEIEKVETNTKSIEEIVLMFQELYDRYRVLLNNQVDLDKVTVLDTPWAGRRDTLRWSCTLLHTVLIIEVILRQCSVKWATLRLQQI
jgi:hypothetical protein